MIGSLGDRRVMWERAGRHEVANRTCAASRAFQRRDGACTPSVSRETKAQERQQLVAANEVAHLFATFGASSDASSMAAFCLKQGASGKLPYRARRSLKSSGVNAHAREVFRRCHGDGTVCGSPQTQRSPTSEWWYIRVARLRRLVSTTHQRSPRLRRERAHPSVASVKPVSAAPARRDPTRKDPTVRNAQQATHAARGQR